MFRIIFASTTTTGIDSVVTDKMPLEEALDHLAGMIAAVGENNVQSIQMWRA